MSRASAPATGRRASGSGGARPLLPDVHAIGVPAMVLAVAADGRLRFAASNAPHARMSGLAQARLLGREPQECLDAALGLRLAAEGRRCLDTGSPAEVEAALERGGAMVWWRTTLVPIGGPASAIAAVLGLSIDVTERVRRERELTDAALLDPLTGIGNRRRFDAGLREAIAGAEATGRPFALLLGDVDRFKAVNDRHGHGLGDEVLKRVAAKMRGRVRAGDLVARLGGDEFAVIVEAGTIGAVRAAAVRLGREFADGVSVEGLSEPVGISLGVALWTPGASALDLLRTADLDMYAQKARRRAAG